MNRSSRVTPLVEGGILSGLAILFSLLSTYLPVFGVFINLIWPVPILLLVVRHGWKTGLMSVVVSGILIAILSHPLNAMQSVVGFGLTGIVLGLCFKRELSPVQTLLYGAGAAFVSKLAVLGIAMLVLDINPLTMNVAAMQTVAPSVLEFYRKIGLSQENLDQMGTMLEQMTKMLALIIPAGFIITAFVESYINFILARAILRRLGHYIGNFPPFKHWDFPKYLFYAWSMSTASWVAGAYYFGEQALTYKFGFNAFVIFSIGLLLQGLAVASYYMAQYNVPRFLRMALVFFAISNGFLSQVIVYAGIMDMFFNYRRLERKG